VVSEAALARKQRFLEAKQELGGTIQDITKHYENLDWTVWHEEDGTIVSMSKEPNEELSEKFEVATFTNDQAKILVDKNWNMYRIVTDKKNTHVKYIQVKPVEIDRVATEDFYLYQVDNQNKRVYDIKLSMSKTKLTISAHANIIKEYDDIEISSAIIKGRKIIPFYITTKNDPSFMLHYINLSLEELLEHKQVVYDMPEDYTGASVFTLKLFDNYKFVEEKK
tara:strand:- start:155 stop:823 length:669 start_codon:yes stop_codon:yes gene_type:complete